MSRVALPPVNVAESLPSHATENVFYWIDRLKALAILWIVLDHIVERIFGWAYAGNPSFDWPPIATRLAQFAPVRAGKFTWPLTAIRDFGWFGDQGVTLFIIISGFGLTWGLLSRNAPTEIPLGAFYRRRALRVFPLWWGAHIFFLFTGAFAYGLSPLDWQFYASLAGLRFIPGVFEYFSPAWWYVGLLIQLYLVYPFLWRILRQRGATVLLGLGSLAGFAALAIGPSIFHNSYLDVWQRGGIFITRLPEFVLGIALASWWYARPAETASRLRSPITWCAALGTYAIATALSFTLRGMIVAPALLGASAFVIFLPLVMASRKRDDVFQRLGRQSYAVYLVHDTFVLLFVPAVFSLVKAGLGIGLALVATALASWALTAGTKAAQNVFRRLQRGRGTAVAVCSTVGVALGCIALPLVADLAILTLDPQEVEGWGERISLAPSKPFGWTLAPDRTTRLRWQSYDYNVSANALGFPGPLFAQAKPARALRVFVTGDAFSSAEGVDTNLAWPRVMQRDLQSLEPSQNVQILNFSITGYGPNQEAPVVGAFVPRYRPNIVLIEMFANDVEDALTSNAAFRQSIGFAQPPPTGLSSIVALAQLKAWTRLKIVDPLETLLKRAPTAEGYFLGSFRLLERGHPEYDVAGVRATAERYEEIVATAKRTGASVIVVFVPTPVEVCGPASLRYYPRFTHLSDRARYDTSLPERRAAEIAAAARVTLWDLGPELRSLQTCPFMPRNLHFTVGGNAAVAKYVAARIAALHE